MSDDVKVHVGESKNLHIAIGSVTATRTTLAENLIQIATDVSKDKSSHFMALILGQSACEVAATRTVDAALKLPENIRLQPIIEDKRDGMTLNSIRNRKLYTAVTRDDIADSFGMWQKYMEVAKRRNDLVHKGDYYTLKQSESAASVEIFKALVEHLQLVEERLGLSQNRPTGSAPRSQL